MATKFPHHLSARLCLTSSAINGHRLCRRSSLGGLSPDSHPLARIIQLPALGLVLLVTANQTPAATTVTITNDWAAAELRIVSPKPYQGPPVYEWSDATQGKADFSIRLTQSGTSPPPFPTQFTGSAFASIGPTEGYWGSRPGYTKVFGIYAGVDDTAGCEAQATLDSIWNFTVTGGPAPFSARGFAEVGNFEFTLFDRTTEQYLVSTSPNRDVDVLGTLEPSHTYELTLHHRALFGTGDGLNSFIFGFSDSVQVEYTSAVPEPASMVLTMILLASGLSVRTRRGCLPPAGT